MHTRYLFSSGGGDVLLDPVTLNKAFVLRPLEPHPFLTLGDFFKAVETFLLKDGGRRLCRILGRLHRREILPEAIQEVLIRYEKYGTLYQIASVDVRLEAATERFAVSAALSPEARAALDREADLLGSLNRQYPSYPYLPRMYFRDAVGISRGPHRETFSMALSSWFTGFHEWHFTGDRGDAKAILIWDLGEGYREAAREEALEIIKQAAKILTLYYDTETFYRIYPWHHGAGDFVVKPAMEGLEVRLITVRGYEPIPLPGLDPTPRDALLFFFLDLTLKMRLDKIEGLGDPVWASPDFLPAARDGFLEALKEKEASGGNIPGRLMEALKTLHSLRERDLFHRLQDAIEVYRHQDPIDFSCMKHHAAEHAKALYRVLQGYS